jgi:hypothetical protein
MAGYSFARCPGRDFAESLPAALKGPAAGMMKSMKMRPSAAGVARLYTDFVSVFVLDQVDRRQAAAGEALGMLHGFLPRAYRKRLARLLYEQTIAALCQASGIDRDVLRLPRLMFDIDTPENAAELLVRSADSPVASFLRTTCLSK